MRQIAKQIQTPTGRELQALHKRRKDIELKEERTLREQRRRQEIEDKYSFWRQLWREGYTVEEMANKLGLTKGTVGVRIVNLRKEHPNWFPSRRRKRLSRVDYREWRRLWHEGATISEMGKELGVAPGTIASHIASLRKDHPGWFPLRSRRHLTKVDEPGT